MRYPLSFLNIEREARAWLDNPNLNRHPETMSNMARAWARQWKVGTRERCFYDAVACLVAELSGA
jgi:hypothetical protein